MGRPSLITFSTADNLKLWQCAEQQVERKEKCSFLAMLEMVNFDSAPTGIQLNNQWKSKRFKVYVSSKFGADAYKKLDEDKCNQILRQNKSQIEKQRTQQENQQIRQKQKQEAHEKEQEKQKRQEK